MVIIYPLEQLSSFFKTYIETLFYNKLYINRNKLIQDYVYIDVIIQPEFWNFIFYCLLSLNINIGFLLIPILF